MATTAFFNVTPHPIHIYGKDGKTVVTMIPGHGELRMLSSLQQAMGLVHDIPIISGQKFTGIDKSGPGYKVWQENPTGRFIVSLPMAQYLVNTEAGRDELGHRLLYCPATGPGQAVRDGQGKLIGTYALEQYL